MKKIIYLLFLFNSVLILAQVRTTGTVIDENDLPLEGASVYINNTSIGTTSNHEGEFELNLFKGEFDLIVSFIGYETIRYRVNTETLNKSLKFKLTPKRNVLDEVVIKKREKMSPEQRKNYLRLFRSLFIGRSKLAEDCKLINDEVLDFDYDAKANKLEISAREPIEIFNKRLGYTIYYDLITLDITANNITYLGYAQYKENEPTKSKKRRWLRNRKRAYKGSKAHFLRAVRDNRIQQEGFLVDIVERFPNPQSPNEEEIKFAREVFRKRRASTNIGYLNSAGAEKDYDKAKKILERAELSPFIERVKQRNVQKHEFTLQDNQGSYLYFKDYLRVTYLRELPDKNYPFNSQSRYQVSMIKLLKEEVPLDESGVLKDPLDVIQLGYWAFEKVGDDLPADYRPPKRN